MKVKLLFVPRLYGTEKHEYTSEHTCTPPLGIPTISSVLKNHGHIVDQDDLDARVFFHPPSQGAGKGFDLAGFDDRGRIEAFLSSGRDEELEALADRLLAHTDLDGFDLVGLSLVGQHNFSALGSALVMAKRIKERKGALVVIGGLDDHDCLLPFDRIVAFEPIDFAITGYGGEPLLNLIYALENDLFNKICLERVSYRNKEHQDIPHYYRIGPDCFFRPDFDGLPLDLYRYETARHFPELVQEGAKEGPVLVLPYVFTFGCPHRCAFCSEAIDKDFEMKPVDKVVTDLEALRRRYGTRYFFFLNTNINPTYKYAEAFADEVSRRGLDIMWSCCAQFRNMDERLLEKLRRAGAVRLIFGLETASPRLLEFIRKGFTVDAARRLLGEAHRLGIWNEIELISGLPHERDEDVDATVRFIHENAHAINYCNNNRFILKKSWLLHDPARFGLANVSRIEEPEEGDEEGLFLHRFDEVGGLGWEEKKGQILAAFDRVNSAVSRVIFESKGIRYYRSNQSLALLFYLYSTRSGKGEIESIVHHKSPRGKSGEGSGP